VCCVVASLLRAPFFVVSVHLPSDTIAVVLLFSLHLFVFRFFDLPPPTDRPAEKYDSRELPPSRSAIFLSGYFCALSNARVIDWLDTLAFFVCPSWPANSFFIFPVNVTLDEKSCPQYRVSPVVEFRWLFLSIVTIV